MGGSNNWFMGGEVSVDTQWKEQNTEFAKNGKPCEIMYLRSTNMQSTKGGIAVDAYSRDSLRASLVVPYEKSHLMKNLERDSFIEVCYKDEKFDTVKPYHGIKEEQGEKTVSN